ALLLRRQTRRHEGVPREARPVVQGRVTASRLATIDVRDYRNLAHVALELPESGLTLIGDNGQGKTNFLEAIYYIQLLRSARGARDADTVRFGAEAFHLRGGIVAPRAADVGIGFEKSSKKKRVRID